jgi:hypothetical protein
MQITDKSTFTHLEHKLADQFGLSRSEMARRRSGLTEGTDWIRVGRWWKYSPAGVEKLKAQLQVTDLAPVAPDNWSDAVVERANWPNRHIISVKMTNGEVKIVRVSPLWQPNFVPRMKIKVKPDGNMLTTRKPKRRGLF